MLVKITSVSIENVVKGKSRYSAATVGYTYQGEPRSQKIMSFVNPGIFKQVSDWVNNVPTDDVNITLTKNSAGYNEWSAIDAGGGSVSEGTAAPSGLTKVVGSNYETKEERAYRQVLIVRQSCIAQAVAFLKGTDDAVGTEDVLSAAETFEAWVFRKDE